MMTLSPAIPILRIFSVDKAKEFYLDFLGFTLAWEHRFSEDLPLYMQMTRTGLTLHRELTAKNYRYARPGLEIVDWGKELNLTDPFGNRLRFCEQSPSA